MRIVIYPFLVMSGLYLVFVLPADLFSALLSSGERGICHLGAAGCEEYWRHAVSLMGIGYVALFLAALIGLRSHPDDGGAEER